MAIPSAALSGLHAEALVRPGTPLRLDGMFNLRDLGGYATAAGGHTRASRIFRADSLARVTDDDLIHLEALGLRMVCDLRRADELESMPNRLPPGVRYEHNPMVLNVNVMGDYRLPDFDWDSFQIEMLYMHMLDNSGATFRRIFELLAETDAYPFLFHCAVGKDRTGMVAGLLLRVAGVRDETIAADFALSDAHIRPKVPEFRKRMAERGVRIGNEAGLAKLFSAPAEAMRATLAHLDMRYGSTRGYLEQIGVSSAQVKAFIEGFVG